ncbi:MAG TPA: YbaK/EbsC family protein [Acidimicrobiales bacterium]|nr:YbaK/EbsC family protein [Acidimicrobiales bacterium]
MHPKAQQVIDAATDAGLSIEVVEHPDGTRTAEDAAAAVGCDVARIVKSLVFTADGAPVLALVGGDARLDEALLADAAGGSIARADADVVRAATGCAIGGVPPFAHATPLPTFVDEPLLAHATVWAAAGTPRHVFEVDPRELVRIAGATVAPLSRTA